MATVPLNGHGPHGHVYAHIDWPNGERGARIHTHRGGGKTAAKGSVRWRRGARRTWSSAGPATTVPCPCTATAACTSPRATASWRRSERLLYFEVRVPLQQQRQEARTGDIQKSSHSAREAAQQRSGGDHAEGAQPGARASQETGRVGHPQRTPETALSAWWCTPSTLTCPPRYVPQAVPRWCGVMRFRAQCEQRGGAQRRRRACADCHDAMVLPCGGAARPRQTDATGTWGLRRHSARGA